MGLLRRKPNEKSLARASRVEGSVEASHHNDVVTAGNGIPSDAGAPIREEAALAGDEGSHEEDREAIVNRLTEALTHPTDRVRCAAARALYRLGESRPLAEAVAILPTDEGRARSIAVRALVALRQPGSSATLAAALMHRGDERPLGQDDADLVAKLIDREAASEGAETVIELAVTGLRNERSIVASRAEELLERLAPASLDRLVEELESGSATYRAALILGRMKDSRALVLLVAALGHTDPHVRRESCAALGELRDPAAAEPLLIATRDAEYDVRIRASEALDRLGTAAIVVGVASLLRPLIASPPGPHALSPATNGTDLSGGDDSLEWELVLAEPPPADTPPENATPAEGSTERGRNQRRRDKESAKDCSSASEVHESATSGAESPTNLPESE
jgi:HEAT repeat protein